MVIQPNWIGLAVRAARITLLPGLVCCGLFAACSPGGTSVLEDAAHTANTAHVVPTKHWKVPPTNEFDDLHPLYSIVNNRDTTLAWTVRTSEDWLIAFEPSEGELAPGQSIELMFEIDMDVAITGGSAQIEFVDRDADSAFGERNVTVQAVVSGDPAGWTTFESSADTRVIYVSSSAGNDSNDGLSPESPKRTIAAGRDMLRHGQPDWLLLRRGDVWNEALGQWKKSGRSDDERMVVSTYGDDPERPLLRTGTQSALFTNGGGGTPSRIENVAFVGLHFVANGFQGHGNCVGAQWLQPSRNILFEDCCFQAYSTNIVFQGLGGRHANLTVRRSVVVDAYSIHDTGDHPQGLYAYGVDGLLIEENVFDHNGWNEDVANAGADIYSHNLYIDNHNTDVVVRGNIISNASSHGLQLRSGGEVLNNLFLRNSIAMLVGGGNNPDHGGVKVDVRANVILDGKDIDAYNPRGWGMCFANVKSGRVAYNVIANNQDGHQPLVMQLDGEHVGEAGPSMGVHHLDIERNIVTGWGGSFVISGNAQQIKNIYFANNHLQDAVLPDPLLQHSHASSTASIDSEGNAFHCPLAAAAHWTRIASQSHPIQYWMDQVGDHTSTVQAVSYHDPNRTPGTYNAYIGELGSDQAFLDRIRAQSRTDWRPEYLAARVNRYLRAGFQLAQP